MKKGNPTSHLENYSSCSEDKNMSHNGLTNKGTLHVLKNIRYSIFLLFFSFEAFGGKVELGSLAGRPDSDLKDLSKTLSSITTPPILSYNEALGWLKFEGGLEQSLYHISSKIKDVLQDSIDATHYLPFLFFKMGFPKGIDAEIGLFLPWAVDHFSVTNVTLKWIPIFLAESNLFFIPGLRQNYTYVEFSNYHSNTWTTDFILSTKNILGIPLYGGGSLIKIWGEYDASVLDATQIRKSDTWTRKYFLGLNHRFNFSKNLKLILALETAFMPNAQAYSLKTTLNF